MFATSNKAAFPTNNFAKNILLLSKIITLALNPVLLTSGQDFNWTSRLKTCTDGPAESEDCLYACVSLRHKANPLPVHKQLKPLAVSCKCLTVSEVILGLLKIKRGSNLLICNLLKPLFSGETGIRTLDTRRYNGFRDRPDRPLRHLSSGATMRFRTFERANIQRNFKLQNKRTLFSRFFFHLTPSTLQIRVHRGGYPHLSIGYMTHKAHRP